jgi:signal transduction histidine kinase
VSTRPLGLPPPAALLVGGVALGGAAAVALRIPDALRWSGSDLVAWAGVSASIALIEQFWIELRHGTERENFSLTDAPFAASLLLVRPSVLTLAVATGAIAGQLLRRVAPLKLAFNVGQFLLALAAAQAIYRSLNPRTGFGVETWLVAIAGMSAYFVVNASTVALVIALVGGERFRSVLLSSLGLSVLHWAGNVALGILGAVVWRTEPKAMPFLVIPLALSYLAYRSWTRGVEARSLMNEMATTAAAISTQDDLTRRIAETGASDEVALLAATLNRMLDRLEGAFHRERRFFSELSHELRTPITICRGHLEVLRPGASRGEVEETVAVVVDELARMGRMVEEMTILARSEDPEFLDREPVSIAQLVHEVARKAAPLTDGRLRLEPVPADALVEADPQRLTQALINLLHNAVLHGRPDGPIELRVQREPEMWRFQVADRGGGLPAGEEENVFRPFHRLDSAGGGTGLGLAIVRGIAEAHGGAAGVDNRPGEGATFWIRVPA